MADSKQAASVDTAQQQDNDAGKKAAPRGPGGKFLSKAERLALEQQQQQSQGGATAEQIAASVTPVEGQPVAVNAVDTAGNAAAEPASLELNAFSERHDLVPSSAGVDTEYGKETDSNDQALVEDTGLASVSPQALKDAVAAEGASALVDNSVPASGVLRSSTVLLIDLNDVHGNQGEQEAPEELVSFNWQNPLSPKQGFVRQFFDNLVPELQMLRSQNLLLVSENQFDLRQLAAQLFKRLTHRALETTLAVNDVHGVDDIELKLFDAGGLTYNITCDEFNQSDDVYVSSRLDVAFAMPALLHTSKIEVAVKNVSKWSQMLANMTEAPVTLLFALKGKSFANQTTRQVVDYLLAEGNELLADSDLVNTTNTAIADNFALDFIDESEVRSLLGDQELVVPITFLPRSGAKPVSGDDE